jgi:fluoride ion exporter CrcB/FEX
MKIALIVLGAAIGGPMRFVVDQKIRTYSTKPLSGDGWTAVPLN